MERPLSDPEVRIELAEMRTQQEWRYRVIHNSLQDLSEDVRFLVIEAQTRRPSRDSSSPITLEALKPLLPYIVGPAILLVVYVMTGDADQAMKASGITR